jgi:hypothetical protein
MSTLKVNAITNLSDQPQFGPVLMTVQSPTTITATFTGIPSWAKRVTVMFDALSTNGSDLLFLQIGDSGGVETSGYVGEATTFTGATTHTAAGTYFPLEVAGVGGAGVRHGAVVLTLLDPATNTWAIQGSIYSAASTNTFVSGTKSLSAALDRVHLGTTSGSTVFDAGKINVMYE